MARSTTPVTFLGYTPSQLQPFSQSYMPSCCRSTSSGLSGTQHTFSSSSPCSAQVSCPMSLYNEETDCPRLSSSDCVRNAGHTCRFDRCGIGFRTVHRRVDCVQRWFLRFALLYLYPRPRSVSLNLLRAISNRELNLFFLIVP